MLGSICQLNVNTDYKTTSNSTSCKHATVRTLVFEKWGQSVLSNWPKSLQTTTCFKKLQHAWHRSVLRVYLRSFLFSNIMAQRIGYRREFTPEGNLCRSKFWGANSSQMDRGSKFANSLREQILHRWTAGANSLFLSKFSSGANSSRMDRWSKFNLREQILFGSKFVADGPLEQIRAREQIL